VGKNRMDPRKSWKMQEFEKKEKRLRIVNDKDDGIFFFRRTSPVVPE